jgi:hypothetical protein
MVRRRGEPSILSVHQSLIISAGYFISEVRKDIDCLSPFTSHHQSNVTFWRTNLPTFDLKAYARRGAEARIAELTAELNDIYRAFPDLRRGASPPNATAAGAGGWRRKRKPMSAAQRKAVGQRMKAYWAARKAKKGR